MVKLAKCSENLVFSLINSFYLGLYNFRIKFYSKLQKNSITILKYKLDISDRINSEIFWYILDTVCNCKNWSKFAKTF